MNANSAVQRIKYLPYCEVSKVAETEYKLRHMYVCYVYMCIYIIFMYFIYIFMYKNAHTGYIFM